MAADAWKKYESFPELSGDGTIDLDNHVFKMALFLSTSNAATVSLDALANITNQHANANGYTTGGFTITATWTHSAGTTTFDTTDGVWTAAGGSIVARFAVIYDDTTVTPADTPCCYSLLDNTPADVTVTDGNVLTVQINASGVYTVSGM